MKRPAVDWNALSKRAIEMTDLDLQNAINGILEVLPYARDLDRADEGNREGTYCDEASVFRAELRAREAGA